MGEEIVRLVDLPSYRTGATVVEDENGDYNIYINARYGYNGQQKALEHEMEHIRNDDFRNGLPLEVCEENARKVAGE